MTTKHRPSSPARPTRGSSPFDISVVNRKVRFIAEVNPFLIKSPIPAHRPSPLLIYGELDTHIFDRELNQYLLHNYDTKLTLDMSWAGIVYADGSNELHEYGEKQWKVVHNGESLIIKLQTVDTLILSVPFRQYDIECTFYGLRKTRKCSTDYINDFLVIAENPTDFYNSLGNLSVPWAVYPEYYQSALKKLPANKPLKFIAKIYNYGTYAENLNIAFIYGELPLCSLNENVHEYISHSFYNERVELSIPLTEVTEVLQDGSQWASQSRGHQWEIVIGHYAALIKLKTPDTLEWDDTVSSVTFTADCTEKAIKHPAKEKVSELLYIDRVLVLSREPLMFYQFFAKDVCKW